jgi:ankyrin repeat protein
MQGDEAGNLTKALETASESEDDDSDYTDDEYDTDGEPIPGGRRRRRRKSSKSNKSDKGVKSFIEVKNNGNMLLSIMTQMLYAKADPNLLNEVGDTPLILALRNDHPVQIIKLLVDHKGYLEYMHRDGFFTALQKSKTMGEMTNLLVGSGGRTGNQVNGSGTAGIYGTADVNDFPNESNPNPPINETQIMMVIGSKLML